MSVTTTEMEPKTPSSSAKRQLRRSRTITCNVFPTTRPDKENGLEDRSEDASDTNQKSPPKSSCQALRHAVSALTRLDDFICEKIGAGFFSDVFKVTHRITGQVLALKMNTMNSNRHNMLREVQLLNRLNHQNILRFMGVCVHEGQLHALTEFIRGGSLEQLLENKKEELPWIQRIQLTLGLARGLDYLHYRGYIHRDLTSKNVLIKREDSHGYSAVLADFGLATKIPDALSLEKLPTVGSPYWMAPEVLNGNFYDEKADLFSVGIIMCEITARISADPDVMPRTNNFGVDYVALSKMVEYCPLEFLQLAFKCCQVEPQKRPKGKEIIAWLEKIFKNLQNDIFTRQQKEKKERNGHKRSRSEDNILQVNDSEADTSMEDTVVTPLIIGQHMSRDDPCYVPSSTNPFASIQRFQTGRKLLGTSIDFASELSSPGGLVSPPSTPAWQRRDSVDGLQERRCQSLPSSPILLRRAAERNHLESLHGSARYCNLNQPKGFPPAGRARSKSTVSTDVFAHRLQAQLALFRPLAESLSNTHIPEGEAGDEFSSPAPFTDKNKNNENAFKSPEEGGAAVVNGGCCQEVCSNGQPKFYLPSPAGSSLMPATAVRRRRMCRIKYQSMDGDVMGVPHIQPLHIPPKNNSSGNGGGGGSNQVVVNGPVVVNGTVTPPENTRASPPHKTVIYVNGDVSRSVKAKVTPDVKAKSNGDAKTKASSEAKPKTNGQAVSFAGAVTPPPPPQSLDGCRHAKPPVSGNAKPPIGFVRLSRGQGQGTTSQGHKHLENGSVQRSKVVVTSNGVKRDSGSCSPKDTSRLLSNLTNTEYRETQL